MGYTLLNETIGRITGAPFSAVTQRAQYLRDAGLLTRGGRGRNAPQPTPADAAKLVLAVMATYPGNARHCPGFVKEFTEHMPDEWSRNPFPRIGTDPTLVGVVASFIEDPQCVFLDAAEVYRSQGDVIGGVLFREERKSELRRVRFSFYAGRVSKLLTAYQGGMFTTIRVPHTALRVITQALTD